MIRKRRKSQRNERGLYHYLYSRNHLMRSPQTSKILAWDPLRRIVRSRNAGVGGCIARGQAKGTLAPDAGIGALQT